MGLLSRLGFQKEQDSFRKGFLCGVGVGLCFTGKLAELLW